MVGQILQSNEKARGILEGFLTAEREELTELLCHRVTDRQTAAAVAGSATNAIGGAIFLWEREDGIALAEALDITWKGLMEASRLLVATSEGC